MRQLRCSVYKDASLRNSQPFFGAELMQDVVEHYCQSGFGNNPSFALDKVASIEGKQSTFDFVIRPQQCSFAIVLKHPDDLKFGESLELWVLLC
jgi:hypothetical protein